jgi:hypothetical protein
MPLLAFGDNKWQKGFVQVFTIECISKWTLSRGVHQIKWLLAAEEKCIEVIDKSQGILKWEASLYSWPPV